ncbi:hypothetical protein [Roseisolibacter sp. H3M3-2]|uniref:tail completion protein gp17 n=1 Tax=Roseisolibacter sp. H3M3-2 TaxID=3031323 RepID=UPI0023DCD4E8|nr:hypothetical protein [Roseisolibacter sp. H3M3-2]MDF1506265.1 hypothetical protein [Roseisolibacter sp. H3M3-2]
MIDLVTPVQAAALGALLADVPAELGGAVDAPKPNQAPPFNMIGAIVSSNEGGKGDQAERFEFEVHSIYRGTDRGPLLAQSHAVKAALHNRALEADGVLLTEPQWIDGAISEAGPDGVTFAAINTFEIYAEPA